MTRYFSIFTVLLLSTSISWGQQISENSWGQKISEKDSVEIMKKVGGIFDLFENPDFKKFEAISTQKLYCIICFNHTDFSEEPYMLERKDFFDNHLIKIKLSDDFIRATKSKDIMLINENGDRTDITVLFTTYQQDELAPGHEGAQFGLYFKREEGEFKFAGMEVIP